MMMNLFNHRNPYLKYVNIRIKLIISCNNKSSTILIYTDNKFT